MANPKSARDEAARQKAAELRAKTKQDAADAVKEVEQARIVETEKTGRLRALRLAKEAAEKEAAEKEAATLAASDEKTVQRKRTVRY